MNTNQDQTADTNRVPFREIVLWTLREKIDILRKRYRFIVIAVGYWLQLLLRLCCPHSNLESRKYAAFGCPACAAYMSLYYRLDGYYGWRAKSEFEKANEGKEEHDKNFIQHLR